MFKAEIGNEKRREKNHSTYSLESPTDRLHELAYDLRLGVTAKAQSSLDLVSYL